MPQRAKPTHLKIIEGNPGKGKITPEPLGKGLPSCPKYFDDEHRRLWQKIVDEAPAGLLTGSDNIVLEALAVEWQRYRRATMEIMDSGEMQVDKDGTVRRSPWLMIQSKALEAMNTWSAKIGLSPIDRQKLDLDPRLPGYKDPMETTLSAEFRKYSGLK